MVNLMQSRTLLVKPLAAALLLSAVAGCEMMGETEMELSEMPAPVRDAILARTSEQNITQLSREEENGQMVYEVEYTMNGQATEAEFDADGNLLEEGDDADTGEDYD